MKLSLKSVRASRAAGFQGPYGGSQSVLTLYRVDFFRFQMCNRLPEMMKSGDAGIFPVYYSLKHNLLTDTFFLFCVDSVVRNDSTARKITYLLRTKRVQRRQKTNKNICYILETVPLIPI